VQTNDAFVSFINHDGSVNTARWIGVQGPADRGRLTPALVLNEPYGSDIANGMLYVADRDGGTSPSDPSIAVIRKFDMKSGAPTGAIRVERSHGSTTSRPRRRTTRHADGRRTSSSRRNRSRRSLHVRESRRPFRRRPGDGQAERVATTKAGSLRLLRAGRAGDDADAQRGRAREEGDPFIRAPPVGVRRR